MLHCQNPECLKSSCTQCGLADHIPLRCDEVEKDDQVALRTRVEQEMTAALLRACWRCRKSFYKTEGCNHMTCSCGGEMCYLCGKKLQKNEWRQHFSNPPPSEGGRGAGGDWTKTNDGRCRLYVNSDKLNSSRVTDAGQRAYREGVAETGVELHELHGVHGLAGAGKGKAKGKGKGKGKGEGRAGQVRGTGGRPP